MKTHFSSFLIKRLDFSIYVQIGNVIAWIGDFSMFAKELVCDKRRQK